MKSLLSPRTIGMAVVLLTLTTVPAVIHGKIMNRWGYSADLQQAAAQVRNFPQQIGDWKRVADEELDPAVVEELKCAGYINRKYVNEKTGKDVSLLLLVGPPGPLVRHPPEICYGNQANRLLKGPERLQIPQQDTECDYRVLRYRAPGNTRGEFSVCYAWSDGTSWSVPERPRMAFGGLPLLYKLQIHSTDTLDEGRTLPASAEEFLHAFTECFSRAQQRWGG